MVTYRHRIVSGTVAIFLMVALPSSAFAATAKVLVVAGGGGGGCVAGGGAGGVMYDATRVVTAGDYTITIGAGGAGVTGVSAGGANGNNSVFDDVPREAEIVAIGGGLGAKYSTTENGIAGGSGGGAQGSGGTPGSADAGTGTGTEYANAGGSGTDAYTGGGGGGAGAVGTNAPDMTHGGTGGIGIANATVGGLVTLASSTMTHIAGGGGGATWNDASNTAAGGTGGGGLGGGVPGAGLGSKHDGIPNTGGGGGAVRYDCTGGAGAGGSGRITLAYTTAEFTHTGGDATGTSGSETWVTFTSSGTLSLTALGGGSAAPTSPKRAIIFLSIGLIPFAWRRKTVAMASVALVALVAGTSYIDAQVKAPTLGAAEGPTYFAQVDADKVVQRVIVISQENINTGKWGDPSTFVKTSMDGSINKNYAGKGYKYETGIAAFVAPKPTADATLDAATGKWIVPQPIVADSPTSTPK